MFKLILRPHLVALVGTLALLMTQAVVAQSDGQTSSRRRVPEPKTTQVVAANPKLKLSAKPKVVKDTPKLPPKQSKADRIAVHQAIPVGVAPPPQPMPRSTQMKFVDSVEHNVKTDPVASSRRSHRIPSQLVSEKNVAQKVGFSIQATTAKPVEVTSAPPAMDIGSSANNRTSAAPLPVQSGKPNASTPVKQLTNAPRARMAKKLEPMKVRKPLPKLVNPEQFLVNPSQKRFAQEFQEQAVVNTPSADQKPSSRLSQEMLWLDNLPRPSLEGGVRGSSMQRASYNQQGNPFLAYAGQSSLGAEFREGAMPTVKTWRSPNLSHRPVYFEDVNLEQYGNGHGRLQPVVSGVKFFTTAMLLPYHVGAQSPQECVYEMGYYRPGDCNPAYAKDRTVSRRGIFNQLLTFGLVFGGL